MKKTILPFIALFLSFGLSAQTSHTVNSGNFYYTPGVLTINVGDDVTWVNDGGFHNVNFDVNAITGASYGNPESFISAPTSDAVLYNHVFTIEGTYNYDCSVGQHAVNGMTGKVIVVPTASLPESPQEILDNSFTVYFKSNSNELVLDFESTQNISSGEVFIYTLDGKEVYGQNILVSNGENNINIDMKNLLEQGTYIVAMTLGNTSASKTIRIQ
jgi:plastocyanin